MNSLEWHNHDDRTPWQRYRARELKRRAELWAQGKSARQIAEECGVTKDRISEYARLHRDVMPLRGRGRATEEDRRRAREMRAEGMTYLAIACELDRPVSTVRSWIVKGCE